MRWLTIGLLVCGGCLAPGCAATVNNNLTWGLSVIEDHKIQATLKGDIDWTGEADPWSAAQWTADSVNGLVNLATAWMPTLVPASTASP